MPEINKIQGPLHFADLSTYITKDGSNNLSFTDAITGTKTLAELVSAGVSTFLELTDTPSSYVDQAVKTPVVNVGETALEFLDWHEQNTDYRVINDTEQIILPGTNVIIQTDNTGGSSSSIAVGQYLQQSFRNEELSPGVYAPAFNRMAIWVWGYGTVDIKMYRGEGITGELISEHTFVRPNINGSYHSMLNTGEVIVASPLEIFTVRMTRTVGTSSMGWSLSSPGYLYNAIYNGSTLSNPAYMYVQAVDIDVETAIGGKVITTAIGVETYGGTSGGAGNIQKWYDSESTQLVTLTDEGFLGIGTSSPAAKLEIHSDSFFIKFQETDGDTDKKRYSMGATVSSFQLSARNDADAFIRNLVTFKHDGNVGIGTSSPDASLHISKVSNTNQFKLERTGTATAIAWLGAVSDGLNIASDNAGAYGTPRMYIGTSGTYNGRVGIGTSSPLAKLDVKSSSNAYTIGMKYSSGSDMGGFYESSTTGGVFYYKNSSAVTKISLNTNGNSYLLGGNVGIGTSSPSELFHLKSGTGVSTDIGLEESGLGWRIRNDQTDNEFKIDSVTGTFNAFVNRVTILKTGNVGIGLSAPLGKLHIYNSAGSSNGHILLNSTGGDAALYRNNDGKFIIRNNAIDTLTAYNGNVGIGTSSPSANLHVQSAGAIYSGTPTATFSETTNRATVMITSDTDNPTDLAFSVNGGFKWDISARNGGTPDFNFYRSSSDTAWNGTPVMQLKHSDGTIIMSAYAGSATVSMDVSSTGQLIRGTSDENTKNIIGKLGQGLSYVLAAAKHTIEYRYKNEDLNAPDHNHWGFGARGVTGEYGKNPAFRLYKDVYGWDTKQMLAPAYNAISEVYTLIELQQQKIIELEARLDLIEN